MKIFMAMFLLQICLVMAIFESSGHCASSGQGVSGCSADINETLSKLEPLAPCLPGQTPTDKGEWKCRDSKPKTACQRFSGKQPIIGFLVNCRRTFACNSNFSETNPPAAAQTEKRKETNTLHTLNMWFLRVPVYPARTRLPSNSNAEKLFLSAIADAKNLPFSADCAWVNLQGGGLFRTVQEKKCFCEDYRTKMLLAQRFEQFYRKFPHLKEHAIIVHEKSSLMSYSIDLNIIKKKLEACTKRP